MKHLLLALLASGCLYSRAAEVPMPKQLHAATSEAKGVFVFLPGLGDEPEKFVEHGFVRKVNELGFDAVIADAHFGYYRERILRQRLEEDVIAPLRAKGYQEIWLAGISLGGFGAIGYAAQHSDEITGLIALAPFLGDDDVWTPIEAAGGLAKWDPGDVSAIEDRDERALAELWAWLRGYATGEARPAMYLGIGEQDRFIRPATLVAKALPEARVAIEPGGHKWTTWKVVFARLLDGFSPGP